MDSFTEDRNSTIRLPLDDEDKKNRCFYAAISDYDSGGINEGDIHILLAHGINRNGELKIRYIRLYERTIVDSLPLEWRHTGGGLPSIAVSPKWGHLAFANEESVSLRSTHNLKDEKNISRRHFSSLSPTGVLQLHVLDQDAGGQLEKVFCEIEAPCDQHENIPVGEDCGMLVISKDQMLAAYCRPLSVQIGLLRGGAPMVTQYIIVTKQPFGSIEFAAIGNRILAYTLSDRSTVYLFKIARPVRDDRLPMVTLSPCTLKKKVPARMITISDDDRILACFTPKSCKIYMWELNPSPWGGHTKLKNIHLKESISAIRFLGKNTLLVISETRCHFYEPARQRDCFGDLKAWMCFKPAERGSSERADPCAQVS